MIYVGLKCSASLSWFLSAHEIHRPKILSPCCRQGCRAPSWLLPSECPSHFWPRLLSEVSFLLGLLTHQLAREKGPASSCVPCASCRFHHWPESLILLTGQSPALSHLPCTQYLISPEQTYPMASQGPYGDCPLHRKHPLIQSFPTFHHTHISPYMMSIFEILPPDKEPQMATDQVGTSVLCDASLLSNFALAWWESTHFQSFFKS